MKKLFTLLFAAVMALSLSFATFAEDKPAAEKPASSRWQEEIQEDIRREEGSRRQEEGRRRLPRTKK